MKWKKSVKRLLISVGIILLTILADFFIQDYIYKIKYKVVKDDFSHVFQIDSVEEIDNELVLTGWVFKLDEDSISNDFEIILYGYNNDKEYYMDVEDVVREDVNEYFLCEYDYSNSGFVARIRASKLKLDKNNYEVLIRPKNVKKAFETDMYISNGKLMFTEPESFVALDAEGTGLEKIVNDGVLRVHRPDVGMYVYQYKGSLYWIADNKYLFEEDGSTCVQYQLDTKEMEKLFGIPVEKIGVWKHPLNTNYPTDCEHGNHLYDCVGISNSNDENTIREIIDREKKTNFIKKAGLKVVLKSKGETFDNGALKTINGFIPKDEYEGYINNAACVFLPFPHNFALRMSGSLVDAFSNKKTIIGSNIPLFRACANKYDEIVCIYEPSSFVEQIQRMVNKQNSIQFDYFQECHSDDAVCKNMNSELNKIIFGTHEDIDINFDF